MCLRRIVLGPVMVAGFFTLGCAISPPSQPTAPRLKVVPSLKVVVDCGPCEVRPNVPGLIADSYSKEAAYEDTPISKDSEAVLKILEYRARNDVARHLLGWKVGADRIKAVIYFQDRGIIIDKKFLKASTGIEDLARLVGRTAFAKLSRED